MVLSRRNPLKALLPKKNNACISPHLLSLLNNFETSLTASIAELVPKDGDYITVSWMIQAMHSLCETHQSISTLMTTDVDLRPVSEMEESMYADISSKLLELCDAFTSELARLNRGNMLLKLAFSDPEDVSLSHLDCWRQHMASKNPKIENSGEVLSSLVEDMDRSHHHGLYKKVNKKNTKEYEEEKVLMRALYGVKVKTLYIFSVFAAAFSGSSKNILFINIPKEVEDEDEEDDQDEVPWEQAFMELQNMIMTTFLSKRFVVIKDVVAVESGVEMVYAVVQEGSVPNSLMFEPLIQSVMELSERLDLVSKETSCLFNTVIAARDELFERLRTKYEDELAESN